MAFEGLQSKINVLETLRSRVPRCGTGIGDDRHVVTTF